MKEQIRSIFCATCGEATAGLIFDDETEEFSVLLTGTGGETQMVPVEDTAPAALRCLRCQDFLVIEFDRVPAKKPLTFLEKMHRFHQEDLLQEALEEFRSGRLSAYKAVEKLVVKGGFSEKEALGEIRSVLGAYGPVEEGADGTAMYKESGRMAAEVDAILAELELRLKPRQQQGDVE